MSKLDDTTKPKDTKSVTPPSAKDWKAFAKRADELLNQVCTKSPDARHCFDFIGAGCCRCLKTENQLRQELIALEGLLGDKVNDLADEGRAVSADLSSPPQSTIDSEVDKLLDATWAYGVDWTEHKDKSEDDNEVSVYAAQIKSEMKAKLKAAITNLIAQEANKAVVAKLNELLEMGENFYFPYGHSDEVLKAHLQALTADKEQADG